MFTSLIIDGVAKILSIRKDSNSQRFVCRIYSLTGVVPERVVEETIPGSFVFRDKENKKLRFRIFSDTTAKMLK